MRSVCLNTTLLIKYILLLILLGFPTAVIAQPRDLIPLEAVPEVILLSVTTPIPSPAPLSASVLCNCYRFVKSVYPTLPPTRIVLQNLSTTGLVAVFYYARQGLYHYAVVLYETDTHYVIEETNYKNCKQGKRHISKQDPSLLGFFPI